MKYLRNWTIQDAKDISTVMNDKEVLDNLRDGIPFPYTEKDGDNFINSVLNATADSQYTWAIYIDGKVIGSIGIFRKENIHSRTAELGFCIAKHYWGKGIVTAAVKEACEYIFTHTNIIRVFAEPFAHNTASCRVLEKAGFTFEGTLRKNAVKNGNILDMKMYALVQ